MRECGRPLLGGQRLMQGLALHYYCVPGDFPPRKSATHFGGEEWDELMALAARMDAFIRRHAAIMDLHDPARSVALVVDEWGAWHAPEPGTPEGFFFQQGTVRDAVMAGFILNTFIAHAGRVRLANLAQAANVVHAVLLTEGDRLLRTPTWDVFALYRGHHESVQLPVEIDAGMRRWGDLAYPRVSAAATQAADGAITVTLCNLDYAAEVGLALEVRGAEATRVAAQILTARDPQAHNTFAAPDAVRAQAFAALERRGSGWELTLPPHSVLALTLS
jgi:alpha-N-arabinofuranosidase